MESIWNSLKAVEEVCVCVCVCACMCTREGGGGERKCLQYKTLSTAAFWLCFSW